MKQLSSAQVRQMWLDFWATKGHSVEPSVSLVPVNDPTLLWINSGVATLKKYFDWTIIPENPRITNAQKAIRTNDIENVGKTARHHTMFEMLGNFSIGDYFRDEAITWAYELLTSPEWFDFPKDKLYMTYYPDDIDSYNRWIEVGVDPSHLIPIEDLDPLPLQSSGYKNLYHLDSRSCIVFQQENQTIQGLSKAHKPK